MTPEAEAEPEPDAGVATRRGPADQLARTVTKPSVDLLPIERRRRRRPSRRRFWLRRGVVLGLLVLLIGSAWLGVSAALARSALLRAQSATAQLRLDLERGDAAGARIRLAAIRRDTAAARSLTASPPWHIAAELPGAGRTAETVRALACEADILSRLVLPRLIAVSAVTSGGRLRDGDKVDLAVLRTMHAELAAAAPELEAITRRTAALPDGNVLRPVAAGQAALLVDVTALTRTVTQLRDATAIAPAMLGGEGVRRYFVALQTNAELRGSGGLLGAYAILAADDGRLRLEHLGSNKMLRDSYPARTAALDNDFAERYDSFGSDGFWLNSNMSAHFPTVSRIWSSMYERTTGVRIDGSISVDPAALAEILKATGPATGPGGERIGAEDIVALTGQGVYQRYPAFVQDAQRDALQLDIARALYARLIAPASHELGLLPQLGAAAGSGHVRMASNHPGEQAILEPSSVGGALPPEDGPYLQLALNNAGGTKLDYYLSSAIDYAFETAHGTSQDVSATVRLRSDAPTTGLPEYVVMRPDLPGNKAIVPGENRLHLSVYAGRGATLRGASLDGLPITLDAGTERGHPVWSAFVTLAPGQERSFIVAMTERGTDQRVRVVAPPTVLPTKVQILGGVAR